MAHTSSTIQYAGPLFSARLLRSTAFKLIPLIAVATLAGCGGSRLDPFSGIQPGGKGLRGGDNTANRMEKQSGASTSGEKGTAGTGNRVQSGGAGGAAAGGATAGSTDSAGNAAGGASARRKPGAGGDSSAGAGGAAGAGAGGAAGAGAGGAAGAGAGGAGAGAGGVAGAGGADDDVIRRRIGDENTSSMSDGSSSNGAGGRAGAAGSKGDASGGANASGAGGNRAGRSGTNADGTSSGRSGAGGDSASGAAGGRSGAGGDSASGAAGGRSGAGGDNLAGARGDSDSGAGDSTTGAAGGNSGAGGNSAGGAGGRDRIQGGPGGGAGGDSMSGTDGQSLGADPQGRRSGVGVGVGEGGVEDEDKRIAAIEVPNSNVKIDEDFKPQTLGGMLPLVLGVNEEGRFDFDQYALRDDVKSILDSLADKLQSAEYDRLDIIGFTDRIGNRDYNQRLSELRAWAVAQYLIHKGIPDNKVYYEGRGHKDPLTQQGECSGLARDELINCLQKDRRVEIEASIRRKHATITQ